jgi:hypothetical protein
MAARVRSLVSEIKRGFWEWECWSWPTRSCVTKEHEHVIW